MSDYNRRLIAEFRDNGGEVGGSFEGASLLLLHTTGARTGEARVTPLMYQALDGEAVAVFASNNGADTNPAWYHNLVAHPDVEVEIGTEVRPMRARIAQGEERHPIWERQKEVRPAFAEYETMTKREIPVVVLEPRNTPDAT